MGSYSNLFNLQRFLKRYRQNDQPAAFEYLVSNAFSQLLFLPFQTKDNEDNTIRHRVIWYGSVKKNKTISPSPAGPDTICYAFSYYILIECTLRHGANQWRKEFVESIKHFNSFIKNSKVDKKDVYLTLAIPKLHKDTYTGFKQKANEGINIILIESPCLARINDISKMAFTVRHLDIRQLFNNLTNKLRESTSFDKFRNEINQHISEWGKDVLKREKTVFFGIRSYAAMKKAGKNIVGTSDILTNLFRDRIFNNYLKILGGGDLTSYIKDGLLKEKLACLVTTPDEDLFCKVKSIDFRERGFRFIKAVEDIND